MAVEGTIADATRGIIPITWDALSRAPQFGDGLLQAKIDLIKERVFGEVIEADDEDNFGLVVVDYCAKLVALDLITPGIDFWLAQPISESATGTNENHTYEERADELRELKKELLAETRALKPEIEALVGFIRISRTGRPALSSINDELLTPSPQEFPRPYAATDRS
jgi:hypothetical protein